MKSKLLQIAICAFFLILSGCNVSTDQKSDEPSNRLDFGALADLLTERMDLQSGEKVLLVGTPGRFDPLISLLKDRIGSSPGEYLGAISVTDTQPEEWSTGFVEASMGLSDEELRDYLKQVDIGIMLPGATPDDKVYGMIQDNLDEGIGRTIHFHWAGAYGLNGQELEISPEIDGFYQETLLSTDYGQLASDQKRFEEAMRNATISVTTPGGTNISFSIGDRPVTKQSGDASARTAALARNLIDREMELPSGAIRVAPIETSVNGKIAFPDAIWDTTMVSGLVLTFEEGKVTDMTAVSGIEAVRQVMDRAGEPARSFREFALGMNPKIAIPDDNPWIPYYGYGAGVVRLSLGDNSELGGNVTGGFVRWNFFTDASVRVGEDLWVENGKLLK